jgi:hypothetical protein
VYRRPVRRLGDEYVLDLSDEERAVLHRFCVDLRGLVEADDEAVGRLFPPAFRDDPEASAEFDRLARSGLVAGRLEAIDSMLATLDSRRVTHAELEAWCGAVNDLRLVLGERLGVSESLYETGIDPNDPRASELALYGWLSWLQGELVECLAERL